MDRLARATSYPYAAPHASYVLTRQGAVALAEGALPSDLEQRVPVLAVGSNRAPEQLLRKFAPLGRTTLPVTTARLADFDSVYSAHLTRYGAVPATLQHSPGTTVTLAVTWLTAAQLARMHATEAGNYHYGMLDGIRLESAGRVLDRVHAYASHRGCLCFDGQPLALAAIAAEGRRFAAATETEALDKVRARLSPSERLDDFVGIAISESGIRAAHTLAMATDALPLAYARYHTFAI